MRGALLGPVVLLVLWSTNFARSQRKSSSGPLVQARLIEGKGTLALTGATVIDGTGARPRHDAVIVIVKDRIVYVGDAAGVRLGPGTQVMHLAGRWMTPGVAFHRELELLVSAGVPPLDVLRIATRNGAEALGILQEAGTIEAGKRADLVVLTADPLAAIANTRKIERVFLKGRPFEPGQLLGAR